MCACVCVLMTSYYDFLGDFVDNVNYINMSLKCSFMSTRSETYLYLYFERLGQLYDYMIQFYHQVS